MKMKCLYLSLLLALAGCAPSPSPSAHYRCENNRLFNATTTSEQATIYFDGHNYLIPRIRSASGVQFESEDGRVGLYTKGEEAILVVGDATLRECVVTGK